MIHTPVETTLRQRTFSIFWKNLPKMLKMGKCHLFSVIYVCMLKANMTNEVVE